MPAQGNDPPGPNPTPVPAEIDYRGRHIVPGQAKWYEDVVYRPGGYDSWVWAHEQPWLDGVVARRAAAGRTRRLLDFACGTGRIISALAPRFDDAVGVDISPAMLEHAAEKVEPSTRLVCGDVTSDPSLLDGDFDVITAFRFFLNAQPDLREAALAVLVRHLGDGGVLVTNFHGNTWSLRAPGYFIEKYVRRRPVTNRISYREARRLFARHGLRIAEFRGIGLVTPQLLRALGPARAERLEALLARFPRLQYLAVDLAFVVEPAGT